MDFIQLWVGDEAGLEPYADNIATVKALAGLDDSYDMFVLEPEAKFADDVYISLVAVELATHFPNMCFVDVRCKLLAKPVLKSQMPYAAAGKEHITGHLFCVNNQPDVFERIRQRQEQCLQAADFLVGLEHVAQNEVFSIIPPDYYQLVKMANTAQVA